MSNLPSSTTYKDRCLKIYLTLINLIPYAVGTTKKVVFMLKIIIFVNLQNLYVVHLNRDAYI